MCPRFTYNRPGLVVGTVPGVVRRALESGIASSSTLIGTAAFSEAGHGDIENEPVAVIFSGERTHRAKSREELGFGADGINYSGKRL